MVYGVAWLLFYKQTPFCYATLLCIMEKGISCYEKRIERVLLKIANAKEIFNNDKEQIFKFKDNCFSEGIGKQGFLDT